MTDLDRTIADAKDMLRVIARDMEAAEAATLDLPQLDVPTIHHFGPGIYIREITMPAGSLVIGREHRGEGMNMVLKGRLIMVDGSGSGTFRDLTGPALFNSPPGRKAMFCIEETTLQNIWPNPDGETDTDVLEARFSIKSEAWLAHHAKKEAT